MYIVCNEINSKFAKKNFFHKFEKNSLPVLVSQPIFCSTIIKLKKIIKIMLKHVKLFQNVKICLNLNN